MTVVDEGEEQARAATASLERLVAPRPGMGPIVVGIDGSKATAAALAWATEMAKAFEAEVVLVHALPFAAELVQDCPPMGLTDWRAVLRAKLNGPWSEPVRSAGVPFRLRLIHRSAGSALLEAAEETGADLIVVGSRHHRHGHRTSGSLSHYLVRRAPCPVVSIPT